jgi:DNA-binding transcriptional LysR family regulator
VFFAPSAGTLAYEKPVSLCEQHGFRPRVVQEAPQWLTIMRLVGAGLGVTIAPACVRQLAAPNVACVNLRGATVKSDIELAYRISEDRAVVEAIVMVAGRVFREGIADCAGLRQVDLQLRAKIQGSFPFDFAQGRLLRSG